MTTVKYTGEFTSSVSIQNDSLPPDRNEELAHRLNDDMTRAVLPVTVFVGIEVFAAFFGNLLVIYVFLFRYHICNFRYFVLCLAFTDITSSLTTMPGEMVTQLYWYVYPVPQVCKIKSFFNVFTVSAEALCLLTIGFDRYMKVCRPLGWQMKPKHAKYLCGIIYAIAFILAIPVYIFWGTHSSEKIYKNTTVTVTICEKDGKWLHTNHPLQYSVATEVILSICLVIMFVLYVFVVKALLVNRRVRFRKYSVGHRVQTSSSSLETPTETSQNPIETISTPNVSESNISQRNDKKVGNTDESEVPQNMTGNASKRKSRNKTLFEVIVDDDHDPREQQSRISTLMRHANHNKDKPHDGQSNHHSTKHAHRHNMATRVRRKTIIMFILTVVFIITTILYLTLLSFIAKSVLDTLSDGNKAVYFFFFRLYFINHVINPIIYGVLDPHFRQVMKNIKETVFQKRTN